MRKINRLIIHCSATPEGRDDKMEDIRRWHMDKVNGNGWDDIGYHFVIELDGAVRAGRPLEKIGAHTSGYNTDSIGICYVGGMTKDMKKPKDTRTDAQKESLRRLVLELLQQFPDAKVFGHNDFNPGKACPSFNVHEEVWGQDGRMPLDQDKVNFEATQRVQLIEAVTNTINTFFEKAAK